MESYEFLLEVSNISGCSSIFFDMMTCTNQLASYFEKFLTNHQQEDFCWIILEIEAHPNDGLKTHFQIQW